MKLRQTILVIFHILGFAQHSIDASAGIQWMPNENLTFGIEYVTRHSDVPYFAGRGGVTSPNGWNAPIGNPAGYTADLVKHENRFIFSTIFRF